MPGPWESHGYVVYRGGEGGGFVCIIAEPAGRYTSDAKPLDRGSERAEEARANADAITSAPEDIAYLLSALASWRARATEAERLHELLAEYVAESPCDHDIRPEQSRAWDEYRRALAATRTTP